MIIQDANDMTQVTTANSITLLTDELWWNNAKPADNGDRWHRKAEVCSGLIEWTVHQWPTSTTTTGQNSRITTGAARRELHMWNFTVHIATTATQYVRWLFAYAETRFEGSLTALTLTTAERQSLNRNTTINGHLHDISSVLPHSEYIYNYNILIQALRTWSTIGWIFLSLLLL